MKKRFMAMFLTFVLSFTTLQAAVFAQESTSSPAQTQALTLADKAKEQAQALVTAFGVASVQYALIDNGKITITDQVGKKSLTDDLVLDAQTMYGIGSLSKMFVAASVMKLVEEGKIDLDKPVTDYIPEFKMQDERYKQITVRMLLNHSSGLNGTDYHNSFMFGDNDRSAYKNLLDTLSKEYLKADPGAFSVYCNDGFTLAEIVVERVSQVDFTTYIHDSFTEKLGLNNTKTPMDDFDRNQLAKVYNTSYAGDLPVDTVSLIGTGGIYSTAEDACRFASIFMKENDGFFSADTLKAIATNEADKGIWPEVSDNSLDYGLGWDSVRLFPFNDYEIQALVKGGDTLYFHSSLVVIPEHNLAVAVLSSGGASTYGQLLASNILLEALEEKGVISEIKEPKSVGALEKAEIPEEMLQYAGLYATSSALMKIDFDKTDNSMQITVPSIPSYPAEKYFYSKDGTFMDEAETGKLKFVKESNGEVYLWQRAYGNIPWLGQVAMSVYSSQKVNPGQLEPAIQEVWAKRSNNLYLIVNEKYSSQLYFSAYFAGGTIIEEAPDFFGTNRIIDEGTAIPTVQIPGAGGRDLLRYEFNTQDGKEYLVAGNFIFINSTQIGTLYSGRQSYCTIQDKGYNIWYKVDDVGAGKTMTVNVPEKAAFIVYDEQGAFVDGSYISKNNAVELPDGGMIVFIGNPGDKFEITLE